MVVSITHQYQLAKSWIFGKKKGEAMPDTMTHNQCQSGAHNCNDLNTFREHCVLQQNVITKKLWQWDLWIRKY